MDAIPHIALPIAVRGETYATVEQDTTDEVAACVAAILSFPLGYREDDPDFGIRDPSFSIPPIDTSEIEDACETYEPRAVLTISETPYNPADPLGVTVHVEVNVLETEDA